MEACAATGSTIAFAISVSDKVYTLNDAGNTKAAEAMKNRADRSADPNGNSSAKDPSNATAASVTAKVTGKLEGNTINVETIDVQ
ncbi:MAG: hypothetical protein ACLQU1_03855 [Bryobacteraceae bacterium]